VKARSLLPWALAWASTALLTGCTPLLSVDQRAQVVALAVDRSPSEPPVQVTAQWYGSTPSQFVKAGIEPMVQSAAGDGLAQALSHLRAESDRFLDFSFADLVLMGERQARRGLAGAMDDLWRMGEMPETAQVAVVKGRAADLLLSPGHQEAGYLLYTRLAQALTVNLTAVPIPLWRFLSRLHSPGVDPWAPLLAVTPEGFRQVGVALFHQDHMTGAAYGEEATALGWLLKPGGFGDLRVPQVRVEGEPVSLRVMSRTLRVSCQAQGAFLDLTLRTRPRQYWGLKLREQTAAPLERLAASDAWHTVAAALRTTFQAHSDVLGLVRTGCRPAPGDGLAVALTVHVTVYPDEREA
jgi:hypothetical protein